MNPRDAIAAMARDAGLDPNELTRIYTDFYAECPHREAAFAYIREVAARILAEKRRAKWRDALG